MSYEHTQRVLDSPLKGGKLLLLLALAHHADKGGACWPGMSTLAAEARVTDRQVRRLLNELEKEGYVAIEERAIGRGKKPHYQLFPKEKAEEMSAFSDEKPEEMSAFNQDKPEEMSAFSDEKADISEQNQSHAGSEHHLGRLGRSLTTTEKRKKPTHLPPSQTPKLDAAQQLAFELLVDSEVGILHRVADELARRLPPQDIFRAVDKWLPDHRAEKVGAGALKHRLEALKPSNARMVNLSARFRDSELFHRHRLPDEMVADPERKQYSLSPEQEPRKRYSV